MPRARAMASPAESVREGAPREFHLVTVGRLAEPDISYFVNDERRAYAAIRGDEGEEEGAEKWTAQKKGRATVAGLSTPELTLELTSTITLACTPREPPRGHPGRALS